MKKEQLILDAKRELSKQIHNTLNDWTYFLGSEEILDFLEPGNLKKPDNPIPSIPFPDQLKPIGIPSIEHARAHVVNQLNFLLSIRNHLNKGQIFTSEQIREYGPKYQAQINVMKEKLEPRINVLDREELENQGLIQDTEILKRYISQGKFTLEEVKHRMEQRKLNHLLNEP